MLPLLYTIHVVVSILLILVVLLQRGKGADLSVFGGGGTQAAFGPRGATTLLHKLTVWGFIAFSVTTITIGFMTGGERGISIMEGVETQGPAPVAEPAPLPAVDEEPDEAIELAPTEPPGDEPITSPDGETPEPESPDPDE